MMMMMVYKPQDFTGLNDELVQMVKDDEKLLKETGIESDKERNLVFYLDSFLNDICEELDCKIPDNRKNIIIKTFNILKNKENISLLDIRKTISFLLGLNLLKNKFAYPNISGSLETNKIPKRDIQKWLRALEELLNSIRMGENKNDAIVRITEGWNSMEKIDFERWSKYYMNDNHEKYAAEIPFPSVENIQNSHPLEMQKKRQVEPNENKRKFLSRIDSAKKILRFLGPPTMTREMWNWMYESLSKLEREIASLQTYSTMQDALIRTSNIWKSKGFIKQANILKEAQPSDITKQIERALIGGTDDMEEDMFPPNELPMAENLSTPQGDMSLSPFPSEPSTKKPSGKSVSLPKEELPKEKVVEDVSLPKEKVVEDVSLPKEELPKEKVVEDVSLPKEELSKSTKTVPEKGENPYEGATVFDILDVLEPLVRQIKERKQVRQLSKVDMMMEALGIVTYFPELSEAMAKIIENNTYVSSRLEKIVGKLKAGQGAKKTKKEEPPVIEMNEQIPKEETTLDVSSPSSPLPQEEATLDVSSPSPSPLPQEEEKLSVGL